MSRNLDNCIFSHNSGSDMEIESITIGDNSPSEIHSNFSPPIMPSLDPNSNSDMELKSDTIEGGHISNLKSNISDSASYNASYLKSCSDMDIESVTVDSIPNSDMEIESVTIDNTFDRGFSNSDMEIESITINSIGTGTSFFDRGFSNSDMEIDSITIIADQKDNTSYENTKIFERNILPLPVNENYLSALTPSLVSASRKINPSTDNSEIPKTIIVNNMLCNSPKLNSSKNVEDDKTFTSDPFAHNCTEKADLIQNSNIPGKIHSEKVLNFDSISDCPSLTSEITGISDDINDSDSIANSIESIMRFKKDITIKSLADHPQSEELSLNNMKNSTKFNAIDVSDNSDSIVEDFCPETLSLSSEHSENVIYEFKSSDVNEKLNRSSKTSPIAQTINNSIIDKIASFNVQNRYEYIIGAELMLKENITLLCIQEPLDSKYKTNHSWISKKRTELNSVRIRCIEHKHQVILIDNVKWGGKEICEEHFCYQEGRVITLMFKFGQDLNNIQQIFGFISCYAVSGRGKSKSGIDKDKIKSTTKSIIQKTLDKWNNKYPGICIIILGDLQETISTDDIDNWGPYRKPPNNDGIVKLLLNSHRSIVRDKVVDKPYWTRMGRDSHRGIDHIFIPQDEYFNKWFGDSAAILKDIGGNYFPSDHSLIFCTILRFDSNNTVVGDITTKYDYGEIFRIPLIRKFEANNEECELEFDSQRFRSSKVTDQLLLYNKIQELTNEDSNCSGVLLAPVVQGTDRLWNDVNDLGDKQEMNLENNNLVIPDDEHFCKLEEYTKGFLSATHKVMKKLALDRHANVNLQAKQKRNHFKRGLSHPAFWGVPTTTKLRYSNEVVKFKRRQIGKVINGLKHIANSSAGIDRTKIMNVLDMNFTKDFDKILNVDTLASKAQEIHNNLIEEENEWIRHITHNELRKSGIPNEEIGDKLSNIADIAKNKISRKLIADKPIEIFDVTPNIIRIANGLLAEASCNQPFVLKDPDDDPYEFLSDNMVEWTNPVQKASSSLSAGNLENGNEEIEMIISEMNHARVELLNIHYKIINAQKIYKRMKLVYLILTSDFKTFARKIKHVIREAPTVHNLIKDKQTGIWRDCENELEQLTATRDFHGKWMSSSKAKETCFFAELVHSGNAGLRGVKLKPNRKMLAKDVKNLIYNGKRIDKDLKSKFIKAHGEHIAKLFIRPPIKKEFHYPFGIDYFSGIMNKRKEIWDAFIKGISGIPGKARYENFQMAVIGRFNIYWQNCLFKLIELMLVIRYVPNCLKTISRHPIPKPGKANETRPISLCHDIFCFVNGIMAKYLTSAMEKADILHPGVTAYRPELGCASLVTTELCFKEDVAESGLPACQLDEDEEKFFDRVEKEIILAAHIVNGFPDQGWVELKASCLDDKKIEIFTDKGIVITKMNCGLEQGNPDSPRCANLVIKFKHDMWDHIMEDCFGKNKGEKYVYYFFKQDPRDGIFKLYRVGYCDDNTRFITAVTDEELIAAVKQLIKQTGDLSMVLKLGRKGTKCDISFFNLKIDSIVNLPEFESFAWSFTKDAPIKEIIPVKCTLRPDDKDKLSNGALNLDEVNKVKKLTKTCHCRHLGLTSDLNADTSKSQLEVIKKLKTRINEIAIHNMHMVPQKYCINTFLVSVPSFAPLQFNYDLIKLKECDSLISQKISKSRGLSSSDSKHRLYFKKHQLGGGIKSIVDSNILAVARELEVELNGSQLSSGAIRGRLYAVKETPINEDISCNHIYDGILKLASLGIFLRDSIDGLANYIFPKIYKHYNIFSIGDSRFKCKDDQAIISKGRKEFNKFCIYGKYHNSACSLVRAMQSNAENILKIEKDEGGTKLYNWWRDAIAQRKMDYAGEFWFWEWCFNPYCTKPSDKNASWIPYISCNNIEDNYFINNNYLEQQLVWEEIENSITLDLFSDNMPGIIGKGKRRKITHIENKILNSGSPILIATDGGHEADFSEGNSKTTAATVLCILDIRDGETIGSREWEDRPVIPLLARCNILPSHYGSSRADIGHGEATGLCMQEEMLDPFIPRCVITDSVSMRERALQFRDTGKVRDRNFVREVLNGMGKGIGTRMLNRFEDIRIWSRKIEDDESYSLNKNLVILQERLDELDKVSKLWHIESSRSEADKTWAKSYNDEHKLRKIIKVDSHQLTNDGNSQINPCRYQNIVPNFAISNCNHWADYAADLAMKKNISDIPSFPSTVPYKISTPCSILRFHFTWNGECIDKKLTKFIENKLEADRLLRLCRKETQGLVFRMWDFSSESLKNMNPNSGWYRAASGFMNCHTRSIYKSLVTRIGLELRRKNAIEKADDSLDQILSNSPSKLVKNQENLRCSWCDLQSDANPKTKCKLGKGLRGNRRHAVFFCDCTELSIIRNGLDYLIEDCLWNWLDELEKFGGIMAKARIIQKVNAELCKLRDLDFGRLVKSVQARKNYLSIDDWLTRVHAESIYECRSKRTIILLPIFGFSTALADGEMEDKYAGVVDCMHMGLIPNTLSGLIKEELKDICSTLLNLQTAKTIVKKLFDLWLQIIEVVKIKFLSIYRCANSKAKIIEKDLRQEFNLNLNAIKKKRAEIQAVKKSTTDSKSNKAINNPKKKTLSLIQAWSSPTLCTGLTCGVSKGNWCTFEKHKPFWIPLQHKCCARCGRQKAAARKCLAALSGLKSFLSSEENLTEVISNITSWDLTTVTIKSKVLIDLFFDCLNKSKSKKNQRKKIYFNLPTNDRIAMLLFCRELGFNSFDNWAERSKILEDTIRHREISDTNINMICKICTSDDLSNCSHSKDSKPPQLNEYHSPCWGCRLILACTLGDKRIRNALKDAESKEKQNIEKNSIISDQPQKKTEQLGRIFKSRILHKLGLPNEGSLSLDELKNLVKNQGQPLSSVIMEAAIDIIRKNKACNRIYLADAMDLDDQIRNSEEFHFNNIMHVFQDSWAKKKKDGIYILPLCSGSSRSGLWNLIIVQKSKSEKKAWKLGPKNAYKNANVKRCVNFVDSVFSGKGGNLKWIECSQTPFMEAESGARAVLTTVVCDVALRHQMDLELAWSKVGILHCRKGDKLATKARDFTISLFIEASVCWDKINDDLSNNGADGNAHKETENSADTQICTSKKRKARNIRSRIFRKKLRKNEKRPKS